MFNIYCKNIKKIDEHALTTHYSNKKFQIRFLDLKKSRVQKYNYFINQHYVMQPPISHLSSRCCACRSVVLMTMSLASKSSLCSNKDTERRKYLTLQAVSPFRVLTELLTIFSCCLVMSWRWRSTQTLHTIIYITDTRMHIVIENFGADNSF